MSSSLHNAEFVNQIANAVLVFVKDKLELFMREEISNYLTVENPETKNTCNGYYSRTLETQFGKIDDLRVPRDRQDDYQTHCLSHTNVVTDGWRKP